MAESPDPARSLVPLNGSRPPASFEACLRAIERVEQVVEQKTLALQRRELGALADFNRRKSHGLLELTRAVRTLGSPDNANSLALPLRSLQAKLAENSMALQMHLRAVQEVSSLMARAIRDGESDGTYSASGRFRGEGQ
jgi:hypothetical protein